MSVASATYELRNYNMKYQSVFFLHQLLVDVR